jgi:hypothetical protein
MSTWGKVLSVILSLLFSDEFKRLVEFALEAIKRSGRKAGLTDQERREVAVSEVRRRAEMSGVSCGDWLAGFAVETALGFEKPSRLRGIGAESEGEEVS